MSDPSDLQPPRDVEPADFERCYNLALLPDVVWREARGEPFEGQVAVAEVVLNRLDDDRWPDTIAGVVLQRNQFSCYFDHQASIRPAPHDKVRYSSFLTACAAAASAVSRATNHARGANHYLNIEETRRINQGRLPRWYNEKKVVAVIGRHTFLRL